MNRNCFDFILLEVKGYTKNDKEYARIVVYCSFGYLVNLFTTKEIAQKLLAKAKEENFNISNYIRVYYDNNKQQFSYVIDLKD